MRKVLVAGATGRTGSLVMNRLKQHPVEFEFAGFARNEAKVKEMFGSTENFFLGTVKDTMTLKKAILGCDALVILTSSVPQIKETPKTGMRPEYYFADGESPEEIDYFGQKNQIDAAKENAVRHIILVGSMGGTNINHPLNKLGNGNVLIWKRKAEEYLINSGIDYTIIRPGGLLNEPGGKRELIVSKNDEFLNKSADSIPPTIPRADVAELVFQAIQIRDARNKAFDVIAKPLSENGGNVQTNFTNLFRQTSPGL